MTIVATEKVTKKVVLENGVTVYDQVQIDSDAAGTGTVTAQVSTLSVNQALAPVDPGRVELKTNNASYKAANSDYLPPATGFAPRIPEPSGSIVTANRNERGF